MDASMKIGLGINEEIVGLWRIKIMRSQLSIILHQIEWSVIFKMKFPIKMVFFLVHNF